MNERFVAFNKFFIPDKQFPESVEPLPDIVFTITILLLLFFTGCSTSSSHNTASPALTWTACLEAELAGLECATLTVPKDYNNARRGTFSLALVRAKATGAPSERIGTVFFNPGGPGESGVSVVPQIVPALPAELRTRFDFVSWDPRGVGRSSGLRNCTGGSYTLPPTGAVEWDSVTAQMRSSEKAANESCAQIYPDIVPYISTNATVRDLEMLREAVGDNLLTYWGTSYGTRIGFVYAYHYPDRVRAMLLSSPVSPNATFPEFMYGSAVSPDDAVDFYFQAFPSTEILFDRIVESLSTQPLQLPSGSEVTQWDVRGTIANNVKSESLYQDTLSLLETFDTAINGSGTSQSEAKAMLDSMNWLTTYPVNGGATAFIGSLDYAERLTGGEQNTLAAQIRADAPVFGFGASQGLFYTEGISVTPDPIPTKFTNTKTPVLIIGSTNDGLTKYSWAVELRKNFLNSRLITYVGTQHTPYLAADSACVDAYGTDFLVNLNRPEEDATCPNARR